MPNPSTQSFPPTKVLFVCHGNICRSPAAECIFAALATRAGVRAQFEIDSAATHNEHSGDAPYRDTQIELRARGYEVFGRSRHITTHDATHFEYVVCMDLMNHASLISRGFPAARVSLLRSHDPLATEQEVGDPWGYPDQFKGMADVIEAACVALLSKLRAERNAT